MSEIHEPERTAPTALTAPTASALPRVDLKLEVVTIPVADGERARRFYKGLGWRLDAEVKKGEAFHVLQFTPPGSPCSVHVAMGATTAPPGSCQGLLLAAQNIEAARSDLLRRGVEVGEVFHRVPGEDPGPGPHPSRRTYSSYAAFNDPDGNGWLLQEHIAPTGPSGLECPDVHRPSGTSRRAKANSGRIRKAWGAQGQRLRRDLARLVCGACLCRTVRQPVAHLIGATLSPRTV